VSVTLSLRIRVPPEKQRELRENVYALMGPTQAQPGCLGCHFYQDIDNEMTMLLVEEWDSEAQLNKHMQSADFKLVLEMMDLSAIQPEFKIQTISNTVGMEGIAAVR